MPTTNQINETLAVLGRELQAALVKARKAEADARLYREQAKAKQRMVDCMFEGQVPGAVLEVKSKRGKYLGLVKIIEIHDEVFWCVVITPEAHAGQCVSVDPLKLSTAIFDVLEKG